MIDRMLVSLDGSTTSESVLPTALALAIATGASVTLLQVLEPAAESLPQRMAHRALDARLGSPSTAETAARHYLEGLASAFTTAGVATSVAVVHGPAADTIVVTGSAYGLIAMATHGRGGLGRWVYGSVADKVARAATVPVLLVRATDGTPTEARVPQRILVPLDGSALAERALTLAWPLAKAVDAELLLLNSVYWAELAVGEFPYASAPTLSDRSLMEEAAASATAYVQGQADAVAASHGVRTRVQVRFETAADAILACADEEHCDLVVMSTHGRGGLGRWVLGSVAGRVLHAARVPVLLVRAGVSVDDTAS